MLSRPLSATHPASQGCGTMDALTPLSHRTSGVWMAASFRASTLRLDAGLGPVLASFWSPGASIPDRLAIHWQRGLLSSPSLLPNRAIRQNLGASVTVSYPLPVPTGASSSKAAWPRLPTALSTGSTSRLTAQFLASWPFAPPLAGTHCHSTTSPVGLRRRLDLNQLEAGITPRHPSAACGRNQSWDSAGRARSAISGQRSAPLTRLRRYELNQKLSWVPALTRAGRLIGVDRGGKLWSTFAWCLCARRSA